MANQQTVLIFPSSPYNLCIFNGYLKEGSAKFCLMKKFQVSAKGDAWFSVGKNHGICFGSQSVKVEKSYLLGESTPVAGSKIRL
jgi:hypothetical protein